MTQSEMNFLACPHCGNYVLPSSDGYCPVCSKSVHQPPAVPYSDDGLTGGARFEPRRTRRYPDSIYVLGILWIVMGLAFLGFWFFLGVSRSWIWGLAWLGLGLLTFLRQVWAVWIGLIASYVVIGQFVFLVHKSPPVLALVSVVLAHYVIHRSAQFKRSA